jgi:autotransporter strand-loop-strand O-heptosyltransferase
MVKRHYNNDELLKYIERDKETKTLIDKTILLHFNSFCLGDSICFSSFIDSFIEYHKPKYVLISTFFPHLFQPTNDKYEFINANQKKEVIVDKLINVGYDKTRLDDILNGMFYATKRTMLLPQDTKPGKCPVVPYKKNVIQNKISIAPETLKHIAKWNYYGDFGWQQVVDEMVNSGFTVSNVSYENRIHLNNVTGYHLQDDIRVSLFQILESKVFVGLSSGLAWLAWSYNVPVVMISGFTKEHNEFECFRVKNEYSCTGCFNTIQNIKTNCPLFFGTERENECHKTITPKMVIDKINEALLFTTT